MTLKDVAKSSESKAFFQFFHIVNDVRKSDKMSSEQKVHCESLFQQYVDEVVPPESKEFFQKILKS